ncbi:MAG: hypothetical protein IMF26_05170 [Candidatus Fermentithermobacillus carboniphilus]|uniref:Uncharacterized protein n=1 Tax=Candidatus Fermentithermobacillus carboniphilus TaxID=3085328 RepID=A0AAT9LEI6_9FIRM|nr:MAG: hypothetical protein IMF26_05170 [Candidatus Fermentithermobacillus carboniphilus]
MEAKIASVIPWVFKPGDASESRLSRFAPVTVQAPSCIRSARDVLVPIGC